MQRRYARSNTRAGVTLVEVMFAMGTLLIGLLGIASIIPVAASFARHTMDLDRGGAITAQRVAELVAGESFKRDQLLFSQEVSGGLTIGPVPDGQTGPGTLALASYCFDPVMLSLCEQEMQNGTPANGFAVSRFPYYRETYRATDAPNAGYTAVAPCARMFRIHPDYMNPTTAANQRAVQRMASAYKQFSVSSDDLVFERIENTQDPDRSAIPRQIFFQGTGGQLFQRASEGKYSWMATIVPASGSSTALHNMTVVIIKNRALIPHSMTAVRSPPNKSPVSYQTYTDVESNPTNERVVWCDPSNYIGFSGGFGGSVTVVGSQAISDEMKPGEWVMLSRRVAATPEFAVHQWYQIRSMTDTEFDTSGLWRRTVSLSGPNWVFSGTNSSADRTEMTIVDGAIATKQYPISMN